MSDLTLDINLDDIIGVHEDLISRSRELIAKTVQSLAAQTHAKVVDIAQHKLHSRREAYLDELKLEQISDTVWAVVVPEKIMWIEENISAHNMLQDLLSSPKAKTNKAGHKYLVVPFKHSKGGSSTQTTMQQSLVNMIKTELKTRKIPFRGIERTSSGAPKLGKLHQFSIDQPSPKQPHHSVPILNGITIYQRLNKNADGSVRKNKNGSPSVSRDIMTFRVASSSQAGSSKWEHPGSEGLHGLDQAYQWVQDLWESTVKPQIIKELGLA